MNPEVLVLIALPDGSVGAFPLAETVQARLRAADLGFGAGPAPALASVPAERLLDSRQLADLLGVGDTWLEGAAAAGKIPCFRIGRYLRFQPSAVKAALQPRDSLSPPHVQAHELNGQKRRHNQKPTARTLELSVNGTQPKGLR